MGVANEFHVIVTAFAINTSYAIAKPALASLLPDLVPREDLTDAIGLNSLQFVSGQLIGPLIATALFVVAGAAWAFAANAMTYAGPILVMVYLIPSRARRQEASRQGRRIGGVDAKRLRVCDRPPLAGVPASRDVSTSASLEIIRTLAPVLVVQSLNAPESTAGILVAGQSAGSAMGLLLFVPLNRRRLSRQMAAAGLFLQAAGADCRRAFVYAGDRRPGRRLHRPGILAVLPGAHWRAAEHGTERRAWPRDVLPHALAPRQSTVHSAGSGRACDRSRAEHRCPLRAGAGAYRPACHAAGMGHLAGRSHGRSAAERGYRRRTFTAFTRVKDRISASPCSWPMPESFQPPKGTAGKRVSTSLIHR